MKKKFLSFIGLVLFIGAVAFNLQINSSTNQASDLTLKNIEALTASAEESGGNTATCYSTWSKPPLGIGGSYIWVCGLCDHQVKAGSFSDPGICYF